MHLTAVRVLGEGRACGHVVQDGGNEVWADATWLAYCDVLSCVCYAGDSAHATPDAHPCMRVSSMDGQSR